MKIPTGALLKAVAKRKAQGEPSEGQRTSAPKRPTVRGPEPPTAGPPAPPTSPGPPAALEIDLTADTPPEEVAAIRASKGKTAMESPAAPEGPVTETTATGGSAVERPPVTGRSASPAGTRSLGEGPSGGSPPPEQTQVSSPRTCPEEGEGEGNGLRLRVPPESVWVDGRWAEQVLSPAFAPEILEELSRLNLGAFFRESCASLIKLANSLKAARDAIQEGRGLVRESQREADEARERAAVAEEALESARAAHAEEIKIAESLAETSARRLQASLLQAATAENAVVARDLHISELTSAMQAAENRAAEATERARAEEGKAKAAEEAAKVEKERAKAAAEEVRVEKERARAAAEEVRAAMEEANRAREAVGVAEATLAAERGTRAVEVETIVAARSAGVIEEYKASERFVDDLAEASATVFLQGFQHCKEKVARDFHLPLALEIEPDHFGSSDNESAPAGP